MPTDRSRRSLITAAIAATAAVIAGCTRALRSAPSPTGTMTKLPDAANGPSSAPLPNTAPRSTPGTSAAERTSIAPSRAAVTKSTTGVRHPIPTRRGGPAKQINRGPSHSKEVALTFHGAGDISMTREILAIAKTHDARITVMAVGTWLAENPEIGSELLAQGHEVGNHTWSHQDINALQVDQMRDEVIRCRDVLKHTTGTPGHYFRQSQSPDANEQLRAVAGAAGYGVCLSYDLDSMDWTDPGAETVRRNMTAASAGSVVSMHLGHRDTIDALPAILKDLTERGLRAVTAHTLLTS